MTRIFRQFICGMLLAVGLATGGRLAAQEGLRSVRPESAPQPGWTFIPSFAYGKTYDDNIALFAHGVVADGQNDDVITAYRPQGDVIYYGKHTRFNTGYGGSLLDYRSYTLFDRWDQRAHLELTRVETSRFEWSTHLSGSLFPSTDAVELAGVPFSHTGSKLVEGLGSARFRLSSLDSINSSLEFQDVTFDRPEELRPYLRGGRAMASTSTYRRRLDERTSVGADYVFRHGTTIDSSEESITNTAEFAVEHRLSENWNLHGGAGVVHLLATPISPSYTSPSFRASASRSIRGTAFHVGYQRTLVPSFGYGGTVQTQDVQIGYLTPLFHSRSLYIDNSAIFRDDTPVVSSPGRLPLRSLRLVSAVGWTFQPWARIEGFYARTAQSSLVPGGRLDRNRIGFQIVTFKPVRIE